MIDILKKSIQKSCKDLIFMSSLILSRQTDHYTKWLYGCWALMGRLRPRPRVESSLLVVAPVVHCIDDLSSANADPSPFAHLSSVPHFWHITFLSPHAFSAHLPACHLIKFNLILRILVRWHYYFCCRDKFRELKHTSKSQLNSSKALCSFHNSNLAWLFNRSILFTVLFSCLCEFPVHC